jgi:hypothetical protein
VVRSSVILICIVGYLPLRMSRIREWGRVRQGRGSPWRSDTWIGGLALSAEEMEKTTYDMSIWGVVESEEPTELAMQSILDDSIVWGCRVE